MSNLILNLRFGYWHFQIDRDRWWIPRLSFNRYRAKHGLNRPWFEVC